MTPERCKNILPTGPSLFPNRSFSPQQWKEVLRTCQAMFLKGQWKQCSSYCIQILIETDDQVRDIACTTCNSLVDKEHSHRSTSPTSTFTRHCLLRRQLVLSTLFLRPEYETSNLHYAIMRKQRLLFPHQNRPSSLMIITVRVKRWKWMRVRECPLRTTVIPKQAAHAIHLRLFNQMHSLPTHSSQSLHLCAHLYQQHTTRWRSLIQTPYTVQIRLCLQISGQASIF